MLDDERHVIQVSSSPQLTTIRAWSVLSHLPKDHRHLNEASQYGLCLAQISRTTTLPFPQSLPTAHLGNPCPSLEVLAVTPLPLAQLPLPQLGAPSLGHRLELQAPGSDTAPHSGGRSFLNSLNPAGCAGRGSSV